MNTGNKNILTFLFRLLKVKFTSTYINKSYEESLQKNSLFEISKILSDYNIKNVGLKLNDKNELHAIETPFLVQINNDIAVIYRITNEQVHCRWREKDIVVPLEEFNKVWNGVVLIAEKTEETREPEYEENLKKQLFQTALKYLSVLSLVILFCIGFLQNNLYARPDVLLLLFTNLIGVYIGYLLIQKQLYIPNSRADKICSLFKKGGCNDVLNSSAAKIFGIIGWSEIGFSYFISNVLMTVLFPQLITYLALINLCALPYSLWSVWYQRFRAKQWCPLCLIVQLLLWIIFFINLIANIIAIPQFYITDILLTAIIYVIPFLLTSFALPKFINEKRLQWITNEMNKLKMKPEVFAALLKQRPRYDVDLSTSQILWGNPDSDITITIVTNPHCRPCAMMHKEVEKLLRNGGDNICVQYIFTSFDENLEPSSIFLTKIYLSKVISIDEKKKIYNEWFEGGKYNREAFFNKYKLEADDQNVEAEVNKHNNWVKHNNIYGTPTILINGYELPYNYRINDIIHFLGLKL